MGKYSVYNRSSVQKPPKQIHPIWRGLGFLLMIGVPILSYFLMKMLLSANDVNHWFPIPVDIISPWGPDPLIFVKIFITLVIIVVISALLMFIRFVLNVMFGPPRYGPLDSPPIRPEGKIKRAR